MGIFPNIRHSVIIVIRITDVAIAVAIIICLVRIVIIRAVIGVVPYPVAGIYINIIRPVAVI
ncbi:hypothetical protein ES703_95740 [subsurface metagenome]